MRAQTTRGAPTNRRQREDIDETVGIVLYTAQPDLNLEED